ncbi:MAG: hypothetical protein LRY36_00345 [Alphaproteobacteria bacterium]|nr:hypothetical protein [Alphaproteobacteria bacterium]
MSNDPQEHSFPEEAETSANETSADEASNKEAINDNDQESPESIEAQLSKLHDRLPKLIAHITNDSGSHEAEAALHKVLNAFRQINELETKLLKDGENYQPLSFSRLFEMAVNGGGHDAQELEKAYLTVTEERDALVSTVESLTFNLGRLKGQAADEIIGRDPKQQPATTALRTAIDSAEKSLKKIQSSLSILDTSSDTSSQKSLDERLMEALGDFDDLSSTLLKSVPASNTAVGKFMRRFGFAYDYKDVAAARQFIQVALRANKKLSQLSDSLLPLQERMDVISKLLDQIELLAGHEERQTPQYQSALEEINRLEERLNKLGDYDQVVASKEEAINLHETMLSQKQNELSAIRNKITKAEVEWNEVIELAQKKLDDLTKRQEALEALPGFQEVTAERDLLKAEREDVISKHEAVKQQLIKEKLQHNSELAAWKNKLRATEQGLLIEKLENELLKLRELASEQHEKFEKEKALREAFEEKVELWVKSEETLTNQVNTWKKRAGLKATYIVAASGASAYAGYMVQTLLSSATQPSVIPYIATMLVAPMMIGAVIGFVTHGQGKAIKSTAAGALIGTLTGVLVGGLGLFPYGSHVVALKDKIAILQDKLNSNQKIVTQKETALSAVNTAYSTLRRDLSNCDASDPCVVINYNNGIRAVPLSKMRSGEKSNLRFHQTANKISAPCCNGP